MSPSSSCPSRRRDAAHSGHRCSRKNHHPHAQSGTHGRTVLPEHEAAIHRVPQPWASQEHLARQRRLQRERRPQPPRHPHRRPHDESHHPARGRRLHLRGPRLRAPPEARDTRPQAHRAL
ncbi:hypothetical protein D7V77_22185, partial [Corallococcus sp. CA041A]